MCSWLSGIFSSQSQFSMITSHVVLLRRSLSRTLRYVLDAKALPVAPGPGMRFGSLQALDAFESELDTFAWSDDYG